MRACFQDLHDAHLLRGWALRDVSDVLYQRDVSDDVSVRNGCTGG